MEVIARLRHLRQSPRKVRLVVDVVRGLPVATAENKLKLLQKRAAEPVVKLLLSAIANAENNFKLSKDTLYIKEIRADEGPTLKRWRARAYGRSAPLRKRTTHVMLVLAEREAVKDAKKEGVAKAAKEVKEKKDGATRQEKKAAASRKKVAEKK